MIWIYLLILVALSAAAFLGGRALARRRAIGAKPHSRPGQHGAYALIWVAAPALLVAILGLVSLFARPLSENATTRLVQASIITGLVASLSVLALMLVHGSRHVPVELGEWVHFGNAHGDHAVIR